MSSKLISDTSVNSEYIAKVMNMCIEAYKNICLLALCRRSDYSKISHSVKQAMDQYSQGKNDSLCCKFESMAFIAGIANELGRSLMGILNMGPNERNELLCHLLKQIDAKHITDITTENVNGRDKIHFKYFFSILDETTDKNAVSGYNLKFSKEHDLEKNDYSYSLDISCADKTGVQEDQYSLLIGSLIIWEEKNGELADFINKTISLNNTEEDHPFDIEQQKDKDKQEKSGCTSATADTKEKKTEKQISHDQASFLVVPYSGLLKEKTNYNTTPYYAKIQIDANANVFVPVSLAVNERLLYVLSEHFLRYKNHLLAKNLLLNKTPYQSNGQINITTFENDLSALLENTDTSRGEEHE